MDNVVQIEDNLYGVPEEIVNAFHQQWDSFPEPVVLNRKDRRVIAVNKAARDLGFPQGIKCYELGGRELHSDCLANKALKDKAAKVMVVNSKMPGPKLTTLTYWVPLFKENDLYVHFNIDITKYADHKKVDKIEGVNAITPLKIMQMSVKAFFGLFNKKKSDEEIFG